MSNEQRPDNINKYLTWQNLFKVVIGVCACAFFISDIIISDSIRDVNISEIKRSVDEIKVVTKETQEDMRLNQRVTDGRLNKIEAEQSSMKTDIEYLKQKP